MCYRESVKNITVSIPDEVYRQVRILAAQRDTSVSAMVKEHLLYAIEKKNVAQDPQSLLERKRAFFATMKGLRVADVMSREEARERKR